jgi:hypothetical protein
LALQHRNTGLEKVRTQARRRVAHPSIACPLADIEAKIAIIVATFEVVSREAMAPFDALVQRLMDYDLKMTVEETNVVWGSTQSLCVQGKLQDG